MTKGEAVTALLNKANELDLNHDLTVGQHYTALIDYLVDELGFLPPPNKCTLVPDNLRGGTKHSPSKREFDVESEEE